MYLDHSKLANEYFGGSLSLLIYFFQAAKVLSNIPVLEKQGLHRNIENCFSLLNEQLFLTHSISFDSSVSITVGGVQSQLSC